METYLSDFETASGKSCGKTPVAIVKTREETIDETTANIASLVLFIVSLVVYGGPYGIIWGFNNAFIEFGNFLSSYLTLAATIIVGMVAHELLHGITWSFFCRHGFRSIRFGINWSGLAPYAHCTEVLPANAYCTGGVMPLIGLGIIPAVTGITSGNGWALMTGIFFTAGSAGDLMILWKLRNYRRETYVQDHPEKTGFIVVTKP